MDGTGIILNNRAGRGFSLQPGHPNILAPGKRTMHTLQCYAVTRGDGTLAFVGGTPGGDQQPQWNMQIIANILDYGMSPQEAVEAPRWTSFPGTDPANLPNPYEVRIERRFPDETLMELRRRGHTVHALPEWGVGRRGAGDRLGGRHLLRRLRPPRRGRRPRLLSGVYC